MLSSEHKLKVGGRAGGDWYVEEILVDPHYSV